MVYCAFSQEKSSTFMASQFRETFLIITGLLVLRYLVGEVNVYNPML